MAKLEALCCYCGSSNQVDPAYFETAAQLGRMAAERGVGIVYGAGGVGLMGALASAALEAGAHVVGVIPEHIEKWELGLKNVSEYLVVENMHVRKTIMFERADAFCALPGGIGTLEELFEVMTWRQLRIHDKPIVLLNQRGYWDPLMTMLERMIDERFLGAPLSKLVQLAESPEDVFALIEAAPEPSLPDDPDQI